jgi:tetratricopeptide (TPR) repeat protein
MRHRSKIAAKHRERAATLGPEQRFYYARIGLMLILLTTFLVYQPALHGGMLIDDEGNITSPSLQPISGLYHIWFDPTVTAQYYPVVHTAFWLEHRLWGDSFVGYHLVTLIWHASSVTLLYFILRQLFVPGAMLAAAIFALHPVMVESVAWMCEQKNTLSTMFYLTAMLMYLKFDATRLRSHYVFALALFVLALLTKTITVTLPAALLVIFWWQRGRVEWRRDVKPLLPFFVVGAATGLVTILVERSYFHGQESDFALTFAQRFLLAGRAIWFYLGKLIWPERLMFTYPRWTIDPRQWWQWIFPIAALGITLGLWLVRKRWRWPLAGWLFFCGTLLPAIGFANVYMFVITFVADHMQYLASLGIIVPAAAAVSLGVGRLRLSARWVGVGICVLLCGSLAIVSRQQSRLYGDVVTYYETLLAGNPDSWLAHNNLGLALSAQGKPQEAFDHYRAAVRIKPNFAIAHLNLGTLHADAGRHSEAIAEFRTALESEPNDPQSLNGIGFALINTGHPAEATQHLRRAIELDAGYADAHNNLGIALGTAGQVGEAIKEFQQALAINNNFSDAHSNWGIVLANIGDKSSAIDHFRQAVQLNPNHAKAHFNLAALLAEAGKTPESISHFEQSIRIHPGFVEAYSGLAQGLASANRGNDAIKVAQKGIEVARSANQLAAAEQLDQWLQHYQNELRRTADTAHADLNPQAQGPAQTQ